MIRLHSAMSMWGWCIFLEYLLLFFSFFDLSCFHRAVIYGMCKLILRFLVIFLLKQWQVILSYDVSSFVFFRHMWLLSVYSELMYFCAVVLVSVGIWWVLKSLFHGVVRVAEIFVLGFRFCIGWGVGWGLWYIRIVVHRRTAISWWVCKRWSTMVSS